MPARCPVRRDEERDRRRAPSPIPEGKSACPSDSSVRSVRSAECTCQYLIDRECLAAQLVSASMVASLRPEIGPLAQNLAQPIRCPALTRQRGRLGKAALGLLGTAGAAQCTSLGQHGHEAGKLVSAARCIVAR